MTETELKPIIEALIYVAEEPLTETTLVTLLGGEHKDGIRAVITGLIAQYQNSDHGIEIKEIANGYKMATKAEHHEWVSKYVRHQTPPTKLSLAALETLAVIAYKQPVTVPEIQEVRGVNAVGVLKTLIDKELVTTAGRKNVIGRPILYKTTKEFLVQFGLKNLDELPSLEEFEELTQSTLADNLVDSSGLAQAGTIPQESLSGSLLEGAPLDETEPAR
jgi:segregation and condensation protein B